MTAAAVSDAASSFAAVFGDRRGVPEHARAPERNPALPRMGPMESVLLGFLDRLDDLTDDAARRADRLSVNTAVSEALAVGLARDADLMGAYEWARQRIDQRAAQLGLSARQTAWLHHAALALVTQHRLDRRSYRELTGGARKMRLVA